MSSKLILPITLLTCFVVACGGIEDPTAQVSSEARNTGGDDPPDWPDPPEDPTPPPPPLLTPGLEVMQRESNRITLRWRDNSDSENGTVIERTTATNNTWTVIRSYGPVPVSYYEVIDTNVTPDSPYCYRARTWNSTGTRVSYFVCAWTPGATPSPVWRAQIRIDVADVDDAGTDDGIGVGLNSAYTGEFPHGNVTHLDYGRDDFERNSSFTYDLDMAGIGDRFDINHIELYKGGEDGVCLREFALLVNNVEVFSRTFGNSSSTCHWLDYGGGQSQDLMVTHAELRAHPSWIAFAQPAVPMNFPQLEMESRLEGLVGNVVHGSGLKWGHIYGRPLEVSKTAGTSDTFHVDLDLEAAVNNAPNPEVDVDLDIRVFFEQSSPGIWNVNFQTVSSQVNVDYAWYWEVLSYTLVPICATVGTVINGEFVWNCAGSIESYVENRFETAFKPISKAFSIGGTPGGCTPSVFISGDGGVLFLCN